ncbi:hypothetical protein R1sor_011254 [Riccia sorocarpa]|uniref:AAA+ ATPase domain-containing protein n=1 Tax=Riccia sorocarpa TaxID=122646 RepID=A0ABD3I0R0_9MARC
MVVRDEQTGFLLRCTDEAVIIIQSLVTILSSAYESAISASGGGSSVLSGALTTDSVEDLHRMLVELLAKLWPCEKRFVAVIGPTGCGKSTLLNVLASMTCRAGEEYRKGIKLDESRAVLRDTVMEHGTGLAQNASHDQDSQLEGNDETQDEPGPAPSSKELIDLKTPDLEAERKAMCALLGICCCQDKEAYFAKHLALYDKCPFLLQNGRMGDAGTTKVTAIQWGPKFAARVKWLEKKKLRKRWRELHSFLKSEPSELTEKDAPLDPQAQKIKESKELWESMLRIVGHPLDSNQVPVPTDELIESTLKCLSKRVALGKEENIETVSSQGCVIDRLYVREGIRKRLFDEKLGLLLEDLVIEAPIPSSEGGVSLLDVPGTNDPRFLHQRETRDAIDRTTLILLILDRSVVDAGTQKVLEDSPVLERMLFDSSERCNLVVVGIAEKRSKSGRPASEIVAEFDSNQDLRKALRSVFNRKVINLVSSRRLSRDEAKERLKSIFSNNRFSVLPVLPLLCASLHLSSSNRALHAETCESSGTPTCPLVMDEEERMRRCLETNIPQLLEMIHSVRIPSSREKLISYLDTAISILKMYTEESTYDQSMVNFLIRERRHAMRVMKNPLPIETLLPATSVNVDDIDTILSSCAEKCILTSEDLSYIQGKIQDPNSLRACNIGINQDLPPVLMRGFRPEAIGNITRELMQPIEDSASCFIGRVYNLLDETLTGDTAWRENHIDQVSNECIGACAALLHDVKIQWKHSLERNLARCTCGGDDGGLQKHVRKALRKAYDSAFKTTIADMRKQRSKKAATDQLLVYLRDFEFGQKVKNAALDDIKTHFQVFWSLLLESTIQTVEKLWCDWIRQLRLLRDSAEHALNMETQVARDTTRNESAGQNLRVTIRSKVSELEELQKRLKDEGSLLQDVEAKYGYSLLQRSSFYEPELLHVTSKQKVNCSVDVADRNERPEIVSHTVQATAAAGATSSSSAFQAGGKSADGISPGTSSARDEIRKTRNLTLPATRVVDVASSPGTPTPSQPSLSSPKPKLAELKRLPSRGIRALDECEAHNLHMAYHTKDKKKRKGNQR